MHESNVSNNKLDTTHYDPNKNIACFCRFCCCIPLTCVYLRSYNQLLWSEYNIIYNRYIINIHCTYYNIYYYYVLRFHQQCNSTIADHRLIYVQLNHLQCNRNKVEDAHFNNVTVELFDFSVKALNIMEFQRILRQSK